MSAKTDTLEQNYKTQFEKLGLPFVSMPNQKGVEQKVDFNKALDQLGLNPTSAGRFFGMSRQHIYNLKNGFKIPKAMALLILILLEMEETERTEWIKESKCTTKK